MLLGDRHADQPAAESRHEVDDLRRDGVGSDDQVSLVLAILLVDENDHATGFDVRDYLGNRTDRRRGRSARLGAADSTQAGILHRRIGPFRLVCIIILLSSRRP